MRNAHVAGIAQLQPTIVRAGRIASKFLRRSVQNSSGPTEPAELLHRFARRTCLSSLLQSEPAGSAQRNSFVPFARYSMLTTRWNEVIPLRTTIEHSFHAKGHGRRCATTRGPPYGAAPEALVMVPAVVKAKRSQRRSPE